MLGVVRPFFLRPRHPPLPAATGRVMLFLCDSPDETVAAGRGFAATLRAGDVLALDGPLGAGKTHFVKGIAAGLGCTDAVTSPTFTLLHEYTGGRLPLFHFDFYRLEDEADVLRTGLDDFLAAGGVVAVEWAEKFPALLPRTTRRVRLVPDGEVRRRIEVDA